MRRKSIYNSVSEKYSDGFGMFVFLWFHLNKTRFYVKARERKIFIRCACYSQFTCIKSSPLMLKNLFKFKWICRPGIVEVFKKSFIRQNVHGFVNNSISILNFCFVLCFVFVVKLIFTCQRVLSFLANNLALLYPFGQITCFTVK